MSVQEADACAVHGERQLQPRPPGGALGRRRSASSCQLIRDCGRRLPTETRLACLIPQREGRPPVAELRAEHSNVFTPTRYSCSCPRSLMRDSTRRELSAN